MSNEVPVSGIFSASLGPISVKNSLNLLAIRSFSSVSTPLIKKLSGIKERSFPWRRVLITPHVLLRSFSHSRILLA